MPINIDVVKDSEGLPSIIVINDGGRIATIIHDNTKGFTIKGSRRIAQRWFPLLFPTEKQTTLSIPEPLEVVTLTGDKIILYDDMENLLKWNQITGTVALDNTYAYNKDQSLKITCGAADSTASAGREFPFPTSNRIRASVIWSISDLSKLYNLQFVINTYDGAYQRSSILRYDAVNLDWELDTTPFYKAPFQYDNKDHVGGAWHKTSWEIDFNTLTWIDFTINENKTTFGNQTISKNVSSSVPYSIFYIVVNNVAGQEVIGWIDDVIIKEVA